MKAVVDRIVQYANRYKLTNVETGEVLGTFDFDEITGTVQQVGTEIDAELFQSIADDLAARVKLSGGELKDTVVTFSDISGTAANVASGDTSATLWGKVKNWFSRLKALAFKNKVAAGDFEAGAIKNADVAADAAIAQGKVNGLTTDYVASISASGRTVTYKNKNGVNMGTFTTQDTTYGIASQSSNGLMSSTDKTKLDGIESGAQKNTVLGVKGSSESVYRTGNVNITKANIGLGNVDNTSDLNKPISNAVKAELDKIKNGTTVVGAAESDEDGNNIVATYAKQNGSYPNLGAGTANSLTAVQIPNNADLNDYVGSEYWGKVFYATGEQAISNSPVPASYVFHLEVLRLSGNTVQVITAGNASNTSLAPTRYFRYVSSNLSYGDWEEIVTADGSYPTLGAGKVENALTIIKDGVSTVYDGSKAKTVEITENGGITVIEIPANESDTLTSEQLQQVKNNPQNTVLRRTVSPEMNEIYCFDSVSMTQGADSAYTFRNVTSMAQNSLTLQAISVNLSSGLWIYSSVQTSAGGGGGGGSGAIEYAAELPMASETSPDFVQTPDGTLYRKKAVGGGVEGVITETTIKGLFKINSNPTLLDARVEENLNFSSNNESFTTFFADFTRGTILRYGTKTVYNGTWTNTAYRTVNFGDTEQGLNPFSGFYEYFTQRASPASPSITYSYIALADA